ncbi:hypothetical protein [Microbulbifer aggregans]|uniref:hypothetical protein n=1 Tax=Microbulbifer aggregans TaxID=1769779 RepID=UPI001CFDE95B|nr:hypothetical protein [Microbulbifer aggregans]
MEAINSLQNTQIDIASKFRNKAAGSVLLIGLALAVMICSSQGVMLPSIDKPEIWFQRSGSVAVFIAVYLEYIAQYQLKTIPELAREGINLSNPYSNYFGWISKACVALAVVGTIVWGYGDLLYLVAA